MWPSHRGRSPLFYSPLICCWLFSLLVLSGCRNSERNDAPLAASLAPIWKGSQTSRMAQRLQLLAENTDPRDTPYLLSSQKAEIIRKAMAEARSVGWQRRLQIEYAAALLDAGRTKESLTELDSLERDVQLVSPDLWPSLRPEVRMQQALVNMRL